MCRPSFENLTPDQQKRFGNGLGPYWLPGSIRALITDTASWFFEDASWRHHDFGYAVGGDRWDRARCDWMFLQAMLKDALSQDTGEGMADFLWLLAAPVAVLLSFVFFAAVRIGGQFGSFEYRVEYASLDEVTAVYR